MQFNLGRRASKRYERCDTLAREIFRYGTISAGIAVITILNGCATPTVVDVKQVGDENLTCAQLSAQYQDAQDFEAKARKDRGITGTNVAAAVLFWPALVGTYVNTDDAINAATQRQKRLETLAAAKSCKL